jgi:hypothetical protein
MNGLPLGFVDELHRECVDARREIRMAFREVRMRVEAWSLRPMPENWGRDGR